MNTLKSTLTLSFLAGALLVSPAQGRANKEIVLRDAASLQASLADAVDTLTIVLTSGRYDLVPFPLLDSTCGNCEKPATPVQATAGLHIRGKRVHLIGPKDRSTVIHTHAGYGLFFDGCEDGLVENLTITDGERDTNGSATDAAVVVKNGRVIIRNNLLTDNIGDSATVAKTIVGVMGICGRENSHLTILNNDIIRNSWDGIALYRDAVASIEGNVVDGVDKARGTQIGGGRGVGIGITWNGKATVRGNLVTRYWKGIGVFVDADGVVQENIVEDIITWGIAYWDADKGKPVGIMVNNVIYKTGACGASITRSREGEHPGRFAGNIIIETGQNPKYDSPEYYCFQCALALHAVPRGFVIEKNLFFNNRRATPDLPDHDMPREDFMRAIQARCSALAENPAFARGRGSQFLRQFCAGQSK